MRRLFLLNVTSFLSGRVLQADTFVRIMKPEESVQEPFEEQGDDDKERGSHDLHPPLHDGADSITPPFQSEGQIRHRD